MNRYFKTTAANYESIRMAMDLESGYPSSEAETWFTPAQDAPRDIGGNPLIAAMPAITARFIAAGAEELSEQEYNQQVTP
jgi:hypothetical protein